MRILLISEMSQRGSGYSTIADGLLGEWDRRHDVVFLAFDYSGFEHPHRAAIVPTDPRILQRQVEMIVPAWRPDIISVCCDLTFHYGLRSLQQLGVPYVGIFPVEADPITHPSEWTLAIDTMELALCESRFGTKLLNDLGIEARYLPIGVDQFYRPPTDEERASARRRWNIEDRFIVFTVADNQERKAFATHLAAFALLRGKEIEWPPTSGELKTTDTPVENAYYIINTKKRKEQIGLDVMAVAERFGITGDILLLEHDERMGSGLEREQLRDLYWAADAFLLLSKAEGLGLPVLEAMACGLPVVGADHTGIAESLGDHEPGIYDAERGFPVESEYVNIDPFGNQYRRWANPLHAARWLAQIAQGETAEITGRALAYVRQFTWARTAQVFEEEVERVITSRAAPQAQDAEPQPDEDREPAGVGTSAD